MSDITLRLLRQSDLSLLLRMENDPQHWHLSSVTRPFTEEELRQYIDNASVSLQEAGQQRFAIAQGDRVLGFIDLYEYDVVHRRAGVGIILDKQHRGKGYGSKALILLIEIAHRQYRLHQLFATIPVDNVLSLALFQRAGFVQSGRKKEWIYREQQWVDAVDFQYLF